MNEWVDILWGKMVMWQQSDRTRDDRLWEATSIKSFKDLSHYKVMEHNITL